MDDELLEAFIQESREHLASIETDLLAIEQMGDTLDVELVNKVFRAAHSIKGASSFFGLTNVKELAHRTETVLDLLRSRKLTANPELTNILLAAFDRLRDLVNDTAHSEEADLTELLAALSGIASPNQSATDPRPKKLVTLRSENGMDVVLEAGDVAAAREAKRTLYSVEYDLIHDVERHGKNVLDIFHLLLESGEILDCALDFEALGTLEDAIGSRLPLRFVYATVLDPVNIDLLFPYNRQRVQVLREVGDQPAPALAERRETTRDLEEAPSVPAPVKVATANSAPAEEAIRVNVGVLERLMNLTGELVLGRNQLRAAMTQNDRRSLVTADQRIHQITSELQDVVMQTRLQPIGMVFSKLPRIVRDLSRSLNKPAELELQGSDVALDKSILEALSDPLTHMVRNAVDHGIESPEVRAKAGKPSSGTIGVAARHDAGQVVIEISDDGGGIDADSVARAAQAKGLVTAMKVAGMSRQEKLSLIFLPGLSTAKRVTDVSGRGVGMDVVKTNLDRLGGKLEIESTPGSGSIFRIKLPLTLAIMPSLIVSVEGERFAIPQINVEELLRVQPEKAKTRIEVVGSTEVLVLRERVLPILRFSDFLDVLPSYRDPRTGLAEVDRRVRLADRRSPRHLAEDVKASDFDTQKAVPEIPRTAKDRRRRAASALEIAVLTTGTFTYGLVVGAFHGSEEIVVKPLGSHLKNLREYAGAAVLGDGSAALILDAGGLAEKAELQMVCSAERAHGHAKVAESADRVRHSLLLFHHGPSQLCAMPVESVVRIEKIQPQQVETIGGRRTMHYRDGSLPLVTLSDTATLEPLAPEKEWAVMVLHMYGREVGLLGTMPVDVVETEFTPDSQTHRQPGIAGSAILRNRTTLLVAVQEIVDAVWPEWRERGSELPRVQRQDGAVVLLAEDSDFFRAQVRGYLEQDGHEVLAAADGEAAWELLCEQRDRVSVVVTDIEMPRLDGLGLAKRIRADLSFADLPLIALTSLAGEEDIARIRAAGVTEYQTKLDRDSLLEAVRCLSPAAVAV